MTMKRHPFRALPAAMLALLLTACGSTPKSNYYLLSSAAEVPPNNPVPTVGVGPVAMPEYLNRDILVFRPGDNQLEITATERWAEPLEDGVARVLALNLASMLDTTGVQVYPFHPGRKPQYGVKLRVVNMDANAQRAQLVAEWLLYDPDSNEALERRLVQLQRPLAAGAPVPQLAGLYSALIAELSEGIAQAIREREGAG